MSDNVKVGEENIPQLAGAPAVERVILQEETKLLNFRTVLAYLDSPFRDCTEAKLLQAESPLQVVNEEDAVIGYASLEVSQGRILAAVVIDYQTPERLLIETDNRLFLGLEGSLQIDEGTPYLDLYGGREKVTVVSVYHLVISTVAPSDPRLLPISLAPVL